MMSLFSSSPSRLTALTLLAGVLVVAPVACSSTPGDDTPGDGGAGGTSSGGASGGSASDGSSGGQTSSGGQANSGGQPSSGGQTSSGGEENGGQGGMGGEPGSGPCADHDCQHGGTCEPDGGDTYSCDCPGDYTGPSCELLRFEPLPVGLYAKKVSPDGAVVVGDVVVGGTTVKAVLYAGGEVLELEPYAGDSNANANDVSEGGDIIIGDSYDEGAPDDANRAVYWQDGGEPVRLPPSVTHPTCFADSVSDDGRVIAGNCMLETYLDTILVRWVDGVVDELGTLEGTTTCWTGRVSGDGETIFASCDNQAVRWTEQTGFESLPDAPLGQICVVLGASEDGLTAAAECMNSSNGDQKAGYRWTSTGGQEMMGGAWRLDPYDLLAELARPFGISADGQIMVGQTADGPVDTAVRWNEADTPERVLDLLVEVGGSAPGWTLDYSIAVSADGQTIVGSGADTGGSRSWIVRLD